MVDVTEFLRTHIDVCERLAPAAIMPFEGWSDGDVRRYLVAAVLVSEIVCNRLNLMHILPKRREAWWNAENSPERYWFGDFSVRKADKIWMTFLAIKRHLGSKGLKVECDAAKDVYGMAPPHIEKIWLGKTWLNPPADVDAKLERVQTFVHEAAHVSGRFSAAESKSYGKEAAHALARWRMRATRNADNYGYYALEVAEGPVLTA